MKANRDLRRNASVRSVALAIAIVMLGACVGRDDEECWSGVDTLYAANIAVSRIEDVERAFLSYVAHADSVGESLPDGAAYWTFERADYDRSFEGRRYWKVWHRAYEEQGGSFLTRRTVDVDNTGTVVIPLHCF